MSSSSVITILRDPQGPLGKRFHIDKDGKVVKSPNVQVSFGAAVMRLVETHEEMAALLQEVGNDPHAAIMPDAFAGIEIGEEFVVMSEKRLKERLGKQTRQEVAGVHELDIDGKRTKVVGRLKENIVPGAWRLLDRDVDAFTPKKFADMSFDEWLSAVSVLLPGAAITDFVKAESTSKRVLRDGAPISSGNSHVWMKLERPEDGERTRQALLVRAIEKGMHWLKPKFSRKTNEQISAGQPTTIIDNCVWTPGRLVFVGKPVAGKGLTVSDPAISVVYGMEQTLCTVHADLPNPDRVREITKAVGCEMVMTEVGGRLKFSAYDLTLDTVLETPNGDIPVREALEEGRPLRCQAPFRNSDSMAGKFNFSGNKRPFVHDVGTGITHWLRDEDWKLIDPCIFPAVDAFEKKTTEAVDKASVEGPRFVFEPVHEFSSTEALPWIIKEVLPKAGLGVVYGASGSGKSFAVLDMAMAIASGKPWRGKKVKQGRVAYVAAEGADGFRKRLAAYAMHNGVDLRDVPMMVLNAAPNLLSEKDAIDLSAGIKHVGGADVIIIDTFAQVTPGANENAGEDIGKALGYCRVIHTATGAMVILIHHSGKDASKGARGWSGLRAAADAELEVVREKTVRKIRLTKSKDGADGLEWAFKLDVVQLGVDEDLDPITSCVVTEMDLPVGGVAERELRPNEAVFVEVVNEIAQSQNGGIEAKFVVVETARRLMARKGVSADEKGNFKRAATNAQKSLCIGEKAIYDLDEETNTIWIY